MVHPQNYAVYDAEGNWITTIHAEHADKYLDIVEVRVRISRAQKLYEEEIEKIQNDLRDITTNVDQAIIINNTKLAPKINEYVKKLDTLIKTTQESLEYAYEDAENAYNKKQSYFNKDAQIRAWNVEGAVRVE